MKKITEVFGAQINLLGAQTIKVEIDIVKNTLHNFIIIGLADKSIEESKERISAAIKNSGFGSLKTNQKITISLSPADLKKEGATFDLTIAMAYLIACQIIEIDARDKIFIGELGLDGAIRPLKGILTIVLEAKKKNFKEIYLPEENIQEASLIEGIKIYGVKDLKSLIAHFKKEKIIKEADNSNLKIGGANFPINFSEIRGQKIAKRAMEIVAAGGHNISLFGPPGVGKSMISKALISILPNLQKEEIIEVNSLYSIYNLLKKIIVMPPFRSPHHTASYTAIIGGGKKPKPGEITLAHRGVLFLDEFPEFDKRVIESLREPLEEGQINISRANYNIQFPCQFILVTAFNPPKYVNQEYNWAEEKKFKKKISNPIIDRIDIWISLEKYDYQNLKTAKTEESSETIKKRVERARHRQKERYKTNLKLNSQLKSSEIDKIIKMEGEAEKILKDSGAKLNLSLRSYYKIIKIARTIADLEEKNIEILKDYHILEALQYRKTEDIF